MKDSSEYIYKRGDELSVELEDGSTSGVLRVLLVEGTIVTVKGMQKEIIKVLCERISGNIPVGCEYQEVKRTKNRTYLLKVRDLTKATGKYIFRIQ